MSEHDPDTWARIERVFHAALALDPTSRLAFVDRECPDNEEVHDEVVGMLVEHDRVQVFDADPPSSIGLRPGPLPDIPVPDRIGPYVIKRQLGDGGTSVVYLASQDYPQREVALKILHPGVVSLSVKRRFVREPEITHTLGSHSGIAKVYAAGVDPATSRPYFVMQYIAGVDIITYGHNARLDERGILMLFDQVSDAVQHAHAHGVVHRDLKPRNILVDNVGRACVLDFGVARMLAGGAPRATTSLDVGQALGTLEYMSPEQLSATAEAAVTTAADVYALGAILHELLVGLPPIPCRDLPLLQAVARVTTEAPLVATKPDLVTNDDLRAILVKSLTKEPGARYQTVEAFRADLRRVLAGDPVSVRRRHAGESLKRFVSRHRRACTAAVIAAVVAASLLGWALVAHLGRTRAEADMAHASRILLGEMFTRVSAQYQSEPIRREVIAAVTEPVQRWARREPTNPDAVLALARLQSAVLDLPESSQSLDIVKERVHVHDLFQKAYALRPTLSAARELHVSMVRVGDQFKAAGDLTSAKLWYMDAFRLIDTWAIREPMHQALASDHFWCCTRLAELEIVSGNQELAAEWTLAQTRSSAKQLTLAPQAPAALFDGLIAGVREAEYAGAFLGQSLGEARLVELVLLGERLLRVAPYSPTYASYHIRTSRSLAQRRLVTGHAGEALSALDRVRPLVLTNLDSDPHDIEVLGAAAFFLVTDARVKSALGDAGGAVSAVEHAWACLRRRIDIQPADQAYVLDMANCVGQLREVLYEQGRGVDADRYAEEALSRLEACVRSPTLHPDIASVYARLLAASGFATDGQRAAATQTVQSAAQAFPNSESHIAAQILVLAACGRADDAELLLTTATSAGHLSPNAIERCRRESAHLLGASSAGDSPTP